MKTTWQVRRAAFSRALRAIALAAARRPRANESAPLTGLHRCRSIGAAALLACAFLLPAFAAQAQVTPNISLQSSQNPSTVNQTVVFTATVSDPGGGANGTPTGTVTVFDFVNFQQVTLGTANLTPGSNGAAQGSVSVSTLSVGSHNIFASYSGDATFRSTQTANSLNQQVLAAGVTGTTTSLMSSRNPSEAGQSVTFTATVTADSGTVTPSGNVSFQDNGSQIGTGTLNGSGVASFSTSTLTAGTTHNITAVYNFDNGNANFASSTSNTVQQNVTNGIPTTVAVTSSPNPSSANQSVTITATVSAAAGFTGSPTGSVDFRDTTTNTDLGTATLVASGGAQKASVNATFTTVQTHNILATYSADTTNFETGTTGNLSQIVTSGTPTTTTIASSKNPSLVGDSVTFTITVKPTSGTGTPTGSVLLTDTAAGGGFQATLTLSGGSATVTTTALVAGANNLSALYNGDGTFAASTASLTQTVNTPAATSTMVSSSLNPSVVGQAVMFTATVSAAGGATGTPTGTVQFSDNGTALGSPVTLSNGVATTPAITNLTVGTHPITAAYSGDSTFAASTASLTQTVNTPAATSTTVSSSLNPSVVGQAVTFTATVSAAGGATGTPTGTVQFSDNGTALGSPVTLSNGVATTPAITTLTAGTHAISTTYSGDNTFASGGTGTLGGGQVVNKNTSSTAVTSGQNPTATGNAVTFTATVTGNGGGGVTPGGTVQFADNGTNVGAPVTLTNGVATVSITFSTAVTHTISATYSGDANFSGSNGSFSETVNAGTATTTTVASSANPSATLTASPNPSTPGQSVTFTATVSVTSGTGTPTGTVTFKDGGTTIGTGNLTPGGTATFTTSTLSSGSHSITAVFGGDTNFSGSTSAAVVEQIGPPADSLKLREMQISTTPVIAAAWGATTSSAMDDAVSAGFGGNPQSLSPAGTGFTYYFNDNAPAQRSTDADQDSLRRYLASPNGSLTSPSGSANSAATDSVKRVDDDFRALGYAGGMPTKAPPAVSSAAPHDWLAWVTVRGTDYWRGTAGNDLKGDQVDVLAGLTRRVSKDFVVGAFGGYEHFDYSSQAFNAVLKGDGWTVGAYLGWKLAPNIRFDAGGAWSGITANDTAGTASGNFRGTRWLVNGGLTGTYPWQQLVLEPSLRVFALWEHENAFTDSLGTFQPARNFETGRASAGVKAIYPFAWTSSTVALSPYAGLYADYYFSRDDAQTVPLLQGFSARVTGGVAASFAGGATLGAGGEFGGIGSATHIWTWTARGRIPF
jgi:Big-like domain-containing protein